MKQVITTIVCDNCHRDISGELAYNVELNKELCDDCIGHFIINLPKDARVNVSVVEMPNSCQELIR